MDVVGQLVDPDHHIRIGLVTNPHRMVAMSVGSAGFEVAVAVVMVLTPTALVQHRLRKPYRQH